MDSTLYEEFLNCLPDTPFMFQGYWVNEYGWIMCPSEKSANAVADLFEAAGMDLMCTSYCDEKDMGDSYGWYAVYVDGGR